MGVLLILLWKHMMVRRQKYFQAIFELASTLSFFLFMHWAKFIIVPHLYMDENETPDKLDWGSNSEITRLADILPQPRWIGYYPESEFTNRLMDEVGARLGLKRLDFFPAHSERGYFLYSPESGLPYLSTDMRIMEVIIVFQNMSGENWPEYLDYTIRLKGDFGTESSFLDVDLQHHNLNGLKYGTFMRIQWAVDTSYIKLRTGKEVPQVVSLQEFVKLKGNFKTRAQTMMDTGSIISTMNWLSFLPIFVISVNRFLEERTSGIQELIHLVGVSLTTLRLSHALNVLPTGLIFAIVSTVILKTGKLVIIENSSGVLIFVLLLLSFNVVVSMAFVCSYLLRESQYVGSISFVSYLFLWLPALVVGDQDMSYGAVLALGFLPHVPMYWFWKEVMTHEIMYSGADFSNMSKVHTRQTSSILMSYIYLLIQMLISYSVSWYLSLVLPGKFGQALHWNFLFKPDYWTKKKKTNDIIENNKISYNPQYFESAHPNSVAGIKIVDVSKVYREHQALKNVSLDVYKGDITVLLGHNGAGKSTLMNIIAGITSATHGKVYVNGMDAITHKEEVYRNLGVCPQHNIFFANLNVQRHIKFFTLLRGKKIGWKAWTEATISTNQLAKKLGLSLKLMAMPSQLSGGMKRRVQLGCALAGGADVLVLDEPTSGLDVETRRELWDLLLSLRGNRTVFLTTHYMEEADALGDRVAAIKDGVLECFGTPMFLKKAMGIGYRLSLTTAGNPQEEAITRLVTSHVPNATLKERTINTLTYNVPTTNSPNFSKLFDALETQRSDLHIDSMGLSLATIEEVFMELCSDIDTTFNEDDVNITRTAPVAAPNKITGMRLYWRQFLLLIHRQVKYIVYKKLHFIIVQCLLPIIIMILITLETNNKESDIKTLSLNLDMYGDREGSRVMYHVEGQDVGRQDVDTVRRRFPKITFEDTNDIAVLKITDNGISGHYLAGVEVNDTDAKVLYTTLVRHAAPVALNLLSNILASHYISGSDGRTITTRNEPMTSESLRRNFREPKAVHNFHLWALVFVYLILFISVNNISLPSKERETGARHIHVMAGCPALLYWLSTMMFHAVLCILTMLIPIAVVALVLDEDDTINQGNFLVTFATILLLGNMAFLAFGYFISYFVTPKDITFILTLKIIIFGLFFWIFYDIQRRIISDSFYEWPILGQVTYAMKYIFIPFTTVNTAIQCIRAAYENAICKAYRHFCPRLIFQDVATTQLCCAGENARCYLCFIYDGHGEGMVILLLHWLVFMMLTILAQRGLFKGLSYKIRRSRNDEVQPMEQTERVLAEEEYVKKTITLPKKQIPDALLAYNLHKIYSPFFGYDTIACEGVNFSVKKGECFGLLGVNGAGKSTIFKMIIAEEIPLKGKIFANGYNLKRYNHQYLKTLSYCPQFFGLDDFLTGKENLEMILTLRGHDDKYVKEEVKNWIQFVGLEKYASNTVASYSGGCQRRIGTAAALCSDADLSLLDEPSAGVDPVARRKVWSALRTALRRQRSIIISSHSMDEMEALCHRIAIMARGRVRALGTATELRGEHAQGYSVVFKLGATDAEEPLNTFKSKLHQNFNCSLRDEHSSMLNYHINETMRLSDLFNALETLCKEFPHLIEDYSVAETTLEEVFLFFAKENRTPNNFLEQNETRQMTL